MTVRHPPAVLLASLVLVAACGGGLDAQEFEDRYDAAYCDFFDRCYSPLTVAALEDQGGPCESWSEQAAWDPALHVEAYEKGTLTLAPEAEACLEALEDASAPCADMPVACAGIYIGQVEERGACLLDAECVEGTHCETRACPGTCVADAAEGAPCEVGSECLSGSCFMDECTAPPLPKGSACDWHQQCETDRCLDGTCVEQAASGEACEVDADCRAHLVCRLGVCGDRSEAFRVPEGEICRVSRAPYCERGLVCTRNAEDEGFHCAQPVGSGEACAPAFPDPCPTGEYCDVVEARCLPRPVDGEACGAGGATSIVYGTTSIAVTCAEGHFCRSGTCRLQGVGGEACEDDLACWSDVCESGACMSPECEPDWY